VQSPQSVLAGRVGGVVGKADVVGHTADVDEQASRRRHGREDLTGEQEGAPEIEPDLRVEIVHRRLGQRPEESRRRW
jgi:hypothetical protein